MPHYTDYGGTSYSEQIFPVPEWSKEIRSDSDRGHENIALSNTGEIFLSGTTRTNLDNQNVDDYEAYIIKFDRDGNKEWVELVGGSEEDFSGGLIIDNENNIYITGGTQSNLDDQANFGNRDVFLSKLNSSGDNEWTRLLGTTSPYEYGNDLAIDSDGFIYLTGVLGGDIDNEELNTVHDAFITKYDSNGDKQWLKFLNGSQKGDASSVAIDSEDNIYFAGYTEGNVDDQINNRRRGFISKVNSEGARQWTRLTGNNVINLEIDENDSIYSIGVLDQDGSQFIAKYEKDGEQSWIQEINSDANIDARGLTINEEGYIFVSGSTDGNLDDQINNGSEDIFISKYDSNGNKNWSKLLSSENNETSYSLEINNDEIYISGLAIDEKYSFLNKYLLVPKEIPETFIRGNSIYTIVDGPSWTEAEANANKLGGHLVTINNEEENDWLHETFDITSTILPSREEKSLDLYWIGLTDREDEGVWEWSSGEPNLYTNWGQGSRWGETWSEPNGSSSENYVHLGWHSPQWNDFGNNNLENRFNSINGISETPFIQRGDSAYVIVEGPTWEEAEANANKLGGHLVTINDAEENQWLVDNFPNQTNWYTYWIGLNDAKEDNIYEWSSGENSSYRNWRPTSGPNRDSGDRSSIGPSYVEFQVNDLNESKAGQWNDHPPNHLNSPLGIAEIKIPFVNQDPTGTPLLTGDFIPGEIIDIDLSGVSDPDNYEGFIPEYSYQWEVSADGENWEIRNQQGSTDLDYVPSEILNNAANYFLTPEDEGKQIRAHISYIDGNGTEESVTTDAFDIATRIDLGDVNIRRFDPGSVSNINLIDFSTLDEKFYRRFDWEEVNYGQLNILAKDDIVWDKVVFRKSTRSDSFTINAVDWDEVNESKYAKSIYRTVDWDDVDYASMSDQLKEDLDWSLVQLKEAKRADDFSVDIVDWNEVNESKYAKSIYRVVDWDDVDYTYMSDQLKDDIDWSRVQIKEAKRADDFSIDVMDWNEINASKTAKGIYRNLDADDFIDIDVNTLLKLKERGLLSRKLKESIRPFINESIVGGTESEPLLDVSDLDFNDVKLDVNFSSDSDKSLNFGIYIIDNLDGAVKDPITGELINPGSIGYEEAALDENNIYFELALTKGDDLTDTFEATDGIDLFAPFMEDQLTGDKYFAFDEANAEGDLFFKSNGDGTIGIKDDKNNDDFDDLLVSLDMQSL